jgi:hypothetical protein
MTGSQDRDFRKYWGYAHVKRHVYSRWCSGVATGCTLACHGLAICGLAAAVQAVPATYDSLSIYGIESAVGQHSHTSDLGCS